MAIRVTQSLIKDLFEYKRGLACGLQIKAKFIDGIVFESTDVQKLGQWFEFIATGGMPKYGPAPVAETLKDGKTLTEKYERMFRQAKNLKKALKHYGFTIISVGETITVDGKEDGKEGTIDLIVKDKAGNIALIDIKSTGLLNDKWSDYGWNVDALDNKEKLLLQAVHYPYLYQKKYGIMPDFYFFVYSTTNEDASIIKVEVDPDRFPRHEKLIDIVRDYMAEETEAGFQPLPDLKRCSECPIKECEHRTTVPIIKTIQY